MARNRMSIFSRFTDRPTGPGRLPEAARRRRRALRPLAESLEGRQLLSTLTVTSADDSGAGTLRNTIALAQSGDTIQCSPSLHGQTIDLTSGELQIAKGLNIQGPGASNLSIRSTTRLFDITTPGADVTISDLTLNGNQFSDNAVSMGGAILNQGGHLTVANAVLPSWSLVGSSPGGSAEGGAIATTGAGAPLAALTDPSVGEDAPRAAAAAPSPTGGDGLGGAIFGDVNTTLSVTGSTFGLSFNNNQANGGLGFGLNGGDGQGGAIAFLGTSLSVVGSTFSGDTANGGNGGFGGDGQGGAIAFLGTSLSVVGSTFSGSNANGGNDSGLGAASGEGGAIFAQGGNVTVDSSTFVQNAVRDGLTGPTSKSEGGAIFASSQLG